MDNSSHEVSLRDHLEALLKAEAKRNDDRAKAAEVALITAYTTAKEALAESKAAADKVADKQNEWRGSINDVITTRISREEHEAARKPLSDKLDDAIARIGKNRGPGRWYEHYRKLFPHRIGLTCYVSIRGTLTDSWTLK